MKVLIRADATPRMGSGHIVRCLALAAALRDQGATVSFAVSELPPHLVRALEQAGHGLFFVPAALSPDCAMPFADQAQVADAQATLAAAGQVDWLLVDSYRLGLPFEDAIRQAGIRLAVIDDLGREHRADLLLDQTLHRDAASRYAASDCTTRLLGPRFALLRPGFAAARQRVSARRGPVRRLFAMMGGTDPDDCLNLVLDAIVLAEADGIPADIVATSSHPALARLRARCAANPGWTLHTDSPDVAELMAVADLAIGAGGTASWERACLGVPSLAICIADNQRELLHEASAAGMLLALPAGSGSDNVAAALRLLIADEGLRQHLSAQGLALVDGGGARRVASAMRAALVTVRPATVADADALLAWRNAPAVREASRMTHEISADEHRQWLDRTLAADDRWLLLGLCQGAEIGAVRFDSLQPTCAEVSIYMSPAALPGDGAGLLAAAERWLLQRRPDMCAIVAEYRADNLPSQALFTNSGYRARTVTSQKRLKT